jgi:hypothetical protein
VDVFGMTITTKTLWIYQPNPTDPNELWRLEYDRRGTLTYQYRLLRLAAPTASGDMLRTAHYDAWCTTNANISYLYAPHTPRS